MEFLNTELSERDKNTLANGLIVAAQRFDEDAKTFEQQKAASEAMLKEDPDAVPIFHPNGCDQLIRQFERQASDTRALLGRLLLEYAPEPDEALAE